MPASASHRDAHPTLEPAACSRREWLASAGAAAMSVMALLLLPRPSAALSLTPITIYKDPDCGCCVQWVKHLGANGFATTARDRRDMDAFKDNLGVPKPLRSCHTAVVGRYLIEGHVPASDIKRLLGARPKGILGLAVPGMPVGAPGMEMGARVDPFSVMAFSSGGSTQVFARHG